MKKNPNIFDSLPPSNIQVELKGLTGPIEFKEGRRIQFKLDLVKLKQHAIVKVGDWSPHLGLNISDPGVFFDTNTMNVTLVVITILVSLGGFKFKSFSDLTSIGMFCIFERKLVVSLSISFYPSVPGQKETRLFVMHDIISLWFLFFFSKCCLNH
jgi:hypothetical protein